MATFDIFPAIAPVLIYRDATQALGWLEKAFGFETHLVIANASDVIIHAEMRIDGCNIIVAPSYSPAVQSPSETNGVNTQTLYVHITTDVDAHCAQAKAAGAKIEQEPVDLPYGERAYKAVDPDGHKWTFAQIKQRMSPDEMGKAIGMKIRTRL